MAKQATPRSSVRARPEPDQAPIEASTLEQQIERRIGPLVPQQQRDEIVRRVTRAVIQHEDLKGPIAHPRHLEAYEKILPGAAERIVRMAEKAQDHNISMDVKVVEAEIKDRQLGMVLGFLALAGLVGLATYAGMSGNNILSGLLLAATVVGSVVAFIKGRNGS